MLRLKVKTFVFLILMSTGLSSFARTVITGDSTASRKTEVTVFLSEICPICQSYTLKLKQLSEKYNSQHVIFIAVFSDDETDKDSVNAFMKKYDLALFMPVVDGAGSVAKDFNATVTPEAFIKSPDGKIVYSGRIDDSFFAVGKRKNVITTNDLEDALIQLLAKKKITQPKTKAVGCILTPHVSK